jgi:hypothetical protein
MIIFYCLTALEACRERRERERKKWEVLSDTTFKEGKKYF